MIFMDIANVHIRQEKQEKSRGQAERKKELFIRFMQLLSSHVIREHTVAFYASELCVTRQYLNRISRLNSDKTAYEWICFFLMREITKRLDTTNETMLQISEHFNFPDQASLQNSINTKQDIPLQNTKRNLQLSNYFLHNKR